MHVHLQNRIGRLKFPIYDLLELKVLFNWIVFCGRTAYNRVSDDNG